MPKATIQVTFIHGGGTLSPVKGKVSGRHYGYHKAPKRLSILEEDFDGRFEKVGNSDSPTLPIVVVEETPELPDDLTLLPHITSGLAETLKEFDAATYGRVAEFGIGELAELLRLTPEQAGEVVEAATRAALAGPSSDATPIETAPVAPSTPEQAAEVAPNDATPPADKKKGGK